MHRVRIVAVLQGGQGDHGLEGRAGRIGRRQRLVEQGLAFIFGQGLVIGRRHALDEQIGVEAGRRQHAQHIARAAVHHHGGAGILAEHLQRPVLDVGVERQGDILARHGRDVAAGILAHHPAAGVHLDLLPAGLAAQIEVLRFLHALLADAEARMVQQELVFAGPDLVEVVLGHARDIADHMGEGAAEVVDPDLAHVGL